MFSIVVWKLYLCVCVCVLTRVAQFITTGGSDL